MPHKFKEQNAHTFRPSATRRPSGLSPIRESPERQARQHWNTLRRAVERRAQVMRNRQRAANLELLKQVRNLNAARSRINTVYKRALNEMENKARKLKALGNNNYREARALQMNKYHAALRRLHESRNEVVAELKRNSTSSAIRRKLYRNGIKRGRHGTSQNLWQNWTNKLWHETERARQVEQFFRPRTSNRSPR